MAGTPKAPSLGIGRVGSVVTLEEDEVPGALSPSADWETESQAGKRSKGSDRARERAGLRTDITLLRSLPCP